MTTRTVFVRFALASSLCLAVCHEWAWAGVSDVMPKPVKLIPAAGAFQLDGPHGAEGQFRCRT